MPLGPQFLPLERGAIVLLTPPEDMKTAGDTPATSVQSLLQAAVAM